MNQILLQQIRDKLAGLTSSQYGTMDRKKYLQEIRDLILGATNQVHGTMNELIYLQQIRNAIQGVPDGQFGTMNRKLYLQEIRDAFSNLTVGNEQGTMDDDLYLAEIFDVASIGSPPSAPTGLTATPVSTSQINLAWTDNATNETAYKIYRSTNGTDYTLIDTIAADSVSYSDTSSVVDGQGYYYKVAAYNGDGEALSDAATTNTLLFGLSSYWKHDETSGNRLDSVGTRHMVPQNTIGNASGKIGNCVTASGSSNYLLATDAGLASLDWSSGFSVVGWLYVPTAYSGRNTVLAKGNTVSVDWALYSNAQNALRFYVADSATGDSIGASATSMTLDAWHFFAGRYNPSTKKAEFRLDAEAWALGNALTNSPRNTIGSLVVAVFGGLYGAARYDETGLWMRYLPDEVVTALRNGGAGTTHPF